MKDTKYQSETMQFIRTLLDKPGCREQQLKLRGTWWDRGFIDQEQQQAFKEAELSETGYKYFDYSDKIKENA